MCGFHFCRWGSPIINSWIINLTVFYFILILINLNEWNSVVSWLNNKLNNWTTEQLNNWLLKNQVLKFNAWENLFSIQFNDNNFDFNFNFFLSLAHQVQGFKRGLKKGFLGSLYIWVPIYIWVSISEILLFWVMITLNIVLITSNEFEGMTVMMISMSEYWFVNNAMRLCTVELPFKFC